MMESKNSLSVANIPEPHFEEYRELTNISRQIATIDQSEMVKKMCSRGWAGPARELPIELP